ncbi:formate/nitrite transporter family protein [Agromyces sp. GXS1127]|uniref:formate/nitrite transporter family protein n=1 Tax=Agromyces sp. GXS1127 TaxID=3424181 RepID=UPI003D319160
MYDRAKAEGRHRLAMPALEQAAGALIAGITIVFGIVALAITDADVGSALGPGPGRIAGALAFGIGFVFLVVGRTELFSENFFDPVAAVLEEPGRARVLRLLRLWGIVLVLNLAGAAMMAAIFVVPQALPDGAPEVLVRIAEDLASRDGWATLARSVAAGALITLMSYLLHATDQVVARAGLAYLVGFLVALGPFDHVVVSETHLLLGWWLGAAVDAGDLATGFLIAAAGNLLGGILLMTFTHVVQVLGARRRA